MASEIFGIAAIFWVAESVVFVGGRRAAQKFAVKD